MQFLILFEEFKIRNKNWLVQVQLNRIHHHLLGLHPLILSDGFSMWWWTFSCFLHNFSIKQLHWIQFGSTRDFWNFWKFWNFKVDAHVTLCCGSSDSFGSKHDTVTAVVDPNYRNRKHKNWEQRENRQRTSWGKELQATWKRIKENHEDLYWERGLTIGESQSAAEG